MEDIDKLKAKYKRLIDQCADFTLKGKNNLYTSANGHMFSQFNKIGQLGIRFSKQVQEAYFLKFNTEQFLSYGAKMKGYIIVTEDMWADEELMIDLLNESYHYVMSLKKK